MKNLIFSLIILISSISLAQTENTSNFNLNNGLALQGYDAVAYFNQQAAVKGNKKFSYTLNKVTYWFASDANRNTFKENPTKYEPAYGGWCSFAMGDSGEKVSVNPKTFKIVDGKLNLFYNAFFVNTLTSWNKDEQNLKVKADKNWQLMNK